MSLEPSWAKKKGPQLPSPEKGVYLVYPIQSIYYESIGDTFLIVKILYLEDLVFKSFNQAL